jgi:hypothetical protein
LQKGKYPRHLSIAVAQSPPAREAPVPLVRKQAAFFEIRLFRMSPDIKARLLVIGSAPGRALKRGGSN